MQRICVLALFWAIIPPSQASGQVGATGNPATSANAFSSYGGFAAPSSLSPAGGPSSPSPVTGTPFYGYHIGSLDVLEVEVYDAPEFSIVQRVRPDGSIRIPLLENLVILEGLSPLEAEDRIAGALVAEEMMVEPIVTVGIREHHANPVLVTGAVAAPTYIQAVGPTTLLEAVTKAGGFTELAGEWILIERYDRSETLIDTRRVSIEDFKHGLNAAQETRLHGGEKVRVVEAPTAFVVGGGRASGPVPVAGEDGSDILEFLSRAGVSPSGSKKLTIFRKSTDDTDSQPPIELNLRKIQKLEVSGVYVKPNDIVYFSDPSANAGRGILRQMVETGVTQSMFQIMWLLWR